MPVQIARQKGREAAFDAKEAAFEAKEAAMAAEKAAWATEKAALFSALYQASCGGQLLPEMREHLRRIVENNARPAENPSTIPAASPSAAPPPAPANPPPAPTNPLLAPEAVIPNTPWTGKTGLDEIWKEYVSVHDGKPALRDVFMVHGWKWLTKDHQLTPSNTFQKLKTVVKAIWLERDQLMADAHIPIEDFREAECRAYQKMTEEFRACGIKIFGTWRDAKYSATKLLKMRTPLLPGG
jgi:hypothetical protein